MKMIDKEHHALRMVEEPEFKNLIEIVSQCPNYKLPKRKVLSTTLLSTVYNKTKTDTEKSSVIDDRLLNFNQQRKLYRYHWSFH